MGPIAKVIPLWSFPSTIRPLIAARYYATQTGLGTTIGSTSQQPRRKAVTAFNDDGRVPWGELSGREKAARTTQQTFNFGLIIAGAVLTGGVAYLMYTEVFSPESKTSWFNRAFDQIRHDKRVIELLGESKKMKAYGEVNDSSWRKTRPVQSFVKKDQYGTEHLMMHFYVEGPLDRGEVSVHMIRKQSESEFVYKYMYMDVPGRQRLYLENADTDPKSKAKGKSKFFGYTLG